MKLLKVVVLVGAIVQITLALFNEGEPKGMPYYSIKAVKEHILVVTYNCDGMHACIILYLLLLCLLIHATH